MQVRVHLTIFHNKKEDKQMDLKNYKAVRINNELKVFAFSYYQFCDHRLKDA